MAGSEERYSGAMESLVLLADSMQQASALLGDAEDDGDEVTQPASFLNVVALGSVGAGKSAVLNSLMGYPVFPTGENGATRAPIIIKMQRGSSSGSSRGLYIVLDGRSPSFVTASDIRHSLQGRLKSWTPDARSGRTQGIQLTLQSDAAPPLKLIDIPGLGATPDDSIAHDFAEHNDAILLVVIPATSAREVGTSRALKLAQELDSEATRTVGVISKVDQAASDRRSLEAVAALLGGNGPAITQEIQWVAMIGQSASTTTEPSDSLQEVEALKSILTQTSPSKLGRVALVETIAKQIRKRLKQRLPTLLSGLHGKSQHVEDELVRLGELRVETSEGTRAIALELCREFEDKFLLHINTGEGAGWRVVASFEGALPKRIKQLPLDSMFELSSVKKLVLEADGYQPYLLSPEKGLKSLIRRSLELAKDPAKSCVDEVHRILVDIVSGAANATPGLGKYPPLKREMVAIAHSALDEYRAEAKKMVVALVDMERAFIPPQHFIRLVQRRMDRLRREDELKGRNVKKGQESEQTLLSKATTPQANVTATEGGSLKEKKQADQENKDAPSSLKVIGDNSAGWLSIQNESTKSWNKKWFVLNEKTNKFAYTKTPDERNFRGIINLEECLLEDGADENDGSEKKSSSSKANGQVNSEASLMFRLRHKMPYKTVLKAKHSVTFKAENMAEKLEWMGKLRYCIGNAQGPSVKGEAQFDSSQRFGSTPETTGETSTVLRRPADLDEDLRLMAQEVRDYVEAVLNSLAANVPKAVVLCQVERAKDAMLNQLYSSISAHPTDRIQELLQEDVEVKRRREKVKRQASMLSRLTRQLSINEARASAATAETGGDSSGSTPRANTIESEDWRVAFEGAGSDLRSPSPTPSQRSSFFRGPSPRRRESPLRRESPMRSASPQLRTPRGYVSNGYGYDENDETGSSRRDLGRRPPPPPPVYRT
jgi:dynamin GTPase